MQVKPSQHSTMLTPVLPECISLINKPSYYQNLFIKNNKSCLKELDSIFEFEDLVQLCLQSTEIYEWTLYVANHLPVLKVCLRQFWTQKKTNIVLQKSVQIVPVMTWLRGKK